MCTTWTYPDNAITALLYVKGEDGQIYPIHLVDDNSQVYQELYNKISKLGLEFKYDRSDEPKPTAEDYVAVDPSSDYVTNRARYSYQINDNAEQTSTLENASQASCRDGEVFVHPDTILTYSVSLPCTVMIGKDLYYKYGDGTWGYGYYYARGGEQTIEITEPGTYHVEKITTGGGISLTGPPAWYGFSTDIYVETVGDNNYRITAKNFTYYTYAAAVKYKNWLTRPTATTVKLVESYSSNKTADLTYITDYIHSLEKRIATLEDIISTLETT